ncbi:acetyl-CoA carboxylase biotin carboxyl carrier protein subunit [Endomicrobiia bacterium]|nr:acetyl-CoA carboxylase biotin carboxyl carrier protein subunit [Endomicrobiia bacterium]GHT54450.1 acetyl-CoA carboxylase biotin carboxyl carrier protein subunit [Endomicrobiia bacterium]
MANDIKSKVKSLYEIMKEEKIQELEVNSKDYSVCIKRKDNNENKQVLTSKKQAIEQTTEVVEEEKDTSLLDKTIKSPITGVFYKSPSPSAPMFVNEGDVVEIGETLCIIEAMKVMNEIKATFKAKIVKILHENGKSVNSGQDLFEVEKV